MENKLYTQDDALKCWLNASTLNFTLFFFKELYKRDFIIGQHHIRIAEALDRVMRGETTRLMINMPPRYGKTEQAVKGFIAAGLAINPLSKFIHLSYSDGLARDNSRGVQEIVRSSTYQRLFPGTMPNSVNTHSWRTQSGGGLYAVSSSGQVTGFGAGLVDESDELEREVSNLDYSATGRFGGAIIIDDPIKPDDARSDLIREKVNQKFETTIRNRVNSRRTPIVIIMQRLDEHDLCGYLQELEPDQWEVLSLPAIQVVDGEERPLWKFKHTIQELYAMREKNSWVFETQYMQNPKPLEGLLYSEFKEYDVKPYTKRSVVKNYTDTADTGSDYLCSIDYVETEVGMFVLDVLFTQKPMEYTEVKTAEMMTKDDVSVSNIESNNGGRGFARNVDRNLRQIGNNKTSVRWFAQTQNKQVRIFTHSADVNNLIYMPTGWNRRWPEFYNAVTNYMKTGRNLHDDAPDALTGMVEKMQVNGVRAKDLF